MMHDTPAQVQLNALHYKLSLCRRCVAAGYFIGSTPVFSGPASAQVIVVGQAPAQVESGQAGEPFGLRRHGRRSLLWDWLERAGWSEETFRTHHYLSAVTKCYPGKSKNGKGDRLPSARERELCRPWREQELAIIQPKMIIAVGRIAIEQFLPELKGQALDDIIGHVFERDPYVIIPLPHPSGVSRWLNRPDNQAKLNEALEQLRKVKLKLNIQ